MISRPPAKLRADLVVRRRVFAGEVKYVVKDPIRLEYCTVDEMSWRILSFCDGKRDLADLNELVSSLFPEAGFDPLVLHSFLESYRSFHFFEDAFERNIMLIERRRTDRGRIMKNALANPLEIHFPAWNPDKFFDRIVHPLRFLWTKWAMAVYVFVFLAAMYISLTHADEMALSFGELWVIKGKALWGLVVLWFILLFSVVLHEFGHGLTTKFYGGAVNKIGFLFLYFNPCLYCDVTEAYFFENKNHKHYVTLAGGIVDLMTAAIGVFIWYLTSPDLFLNQVAHRIAIFNGVSGILVNFNPLMKYDGYYLLSDHLEVPNLRGDSFRYLGIQIRRLFGLPHEDDISTRRERRIFWTYGILAMIYSILVLFFILMMVGGWLVGSYRATGYIITGALLMLMTKRYWMGLTGFVRFFALDKGAHFRRWRGFYLAGLAAVVAAFFLVPLPRHVQGSFLLEPGREVVIRAEGEAFIEDVLVAEGDLVEAGSSLFVLANDRVGLARERAAAVARRAEYQRASATVERDQGGATIHQASVIESRALERYHEVQLSRLELEAPFDATVMTPRLHEKIGVYCTAGDTLLELGDLSTLRAEVLLDERDLGMIRVGEPVELRSASKPGELLVGRIEKISPLSIDGVVRQKYRVHVLLDNEGGSHRPGMGGRARFDAGSVPAHLHVLGYLSRTFRIDFWI